MNNERTRMPCADNVNVTSQTSHPAMSVLQLGGFGVIGASHLCSIRAVGAALRWTAKAPVHRVHVGETPVVKFSVQVTHYGLPHNQIASENQRAKHKYTLYPVHTPLRITYVRALQCHIRIRVTRVTSSDMHWSSAIVVARRAPHFFF